MPYQIIWLKDGTILSNELYLDISYPASISGPITLQLQSPASRNNTSEVLTGVRFYLTGTDEPLLQSWTTISSTKTNLNGGVEISFDTGRTWIRFNSTHGLKVDNTTWIGLPGSAVSSLAIDGQLHSYESATILIRLIIPPGFSDYRVLSFKLGTDFDVI